MGPENHSAVGAICHRISSKLTNWPTLVIGGFLLLLASAWSFNYLCELAISRKDSKIVADVNAMMESSLESLSSSDSILGECGAYESWKPTRWNRTITFKTRKSFLGLHGIAHFENADVNVAVTIVKGPLLPPSLERRPQDQWLNEHPEAKLSIQDEIYGPVTMRKMVVEYGPTRSYVRIEGFANHPDFQPGWSGLGSSHAIKGP